MPGLVLRLINEDLWQERIVHRTGEHVHFARFEEFVTTPPLEGLGASIDTLKRVCSGRVDVLDAIDRVTQRTRADNQPLLNNVQKQPEGNTTTAALRRLRKDRPDLHTAVLAGEKTPHGAMVEGVGWVRVSDVCERLGLEAQPQTERLKTDPSFQPYHCLLAAGTGRSSWYLRGDKVPGWVRTINANKVKPEAREALLWVQEPTPDT